MSIPTIIRFMKKGIAPSAQTKPTKSKSQDEPKLPRREDPKEDVNDNENNDFDVSVYDYEYEGEGYMQFKQMVSVKGSGSAVSVVVKPEKPYFIPLTDVPYPGEVSSEYDLKKLLRGDYCLETDLETDKPENAACIHKTVTVPAEFFALSSSESSTETQESLDSDQEAEIDKYLKNHTDKTSFAGDIVRGISKGRYDHLLKHAEAEQTTLTDDEVRHIRVAREEDKELFAQKRVSIHIPAGRNKSRSIQRRQTGFVRPRNWDWELKSMNQAISFDTDTDTDSIYGNRKVRIDPSILMGSAPTPAIERRPTAFVRPGAAYSDSDIDIVKVNERQSVMKRLFDEQGQNLTSTLRDYRPSTAAREQSMLLTLTPTNMNINSNTDYEHYRGHVARDNLGVPQKVPNAESVIRFPLRRATKTRPSITVGEYQAKNRKLYEE